MSLVRVDKRFRITLPREVRKVFNVSKGQRLYVVATSGMLIIKPVVKDPSEKLAEVLGDFEFNREARRKAEEWLLKGISEGF